MNASMNENQRQQYLQALGIESYMPRWILPAAAESVQLPAETLIEPVSGQEPLPAANSAPEQSAAASPVVDTATLRDSIERPQQRPARRAAEQTATEKPLLHQFALNFWRISPQIGVLDSRQAGAALPTEQLLTNMAAALGISLSLAPPVTVTWPSLGSSSLASDPAQSVREAREMLQAFLAAQHEKQALEAVWLMGGAAIYHGLSAVELGDAGLQDRAAVARVLGQRFALSLRGGAGEANAAEPKTDLIALPGLAAMLNKPPLKALAWKAIKHLRVSR